jgi:hypothetical protein
MRRGSGAQLIVLAPWLLAGCQWMLGSEAIAIRPIYGFVDGCADVKVSGYGLEGPLSATLNGEPLTDLKPARGVLERGFAFTARVPRGDAPGTVDLKVQIGEETSVVPGAFTWLPCPGSAHAESIDRQQAAPDEDIELFGCNLDPAQVSVRLDDGLGGGATLPLTARCGTARATFQVPASLSGAWSVSLVDPDGALLWPQPCDSADSGRACQGPFPLTVGGAP